ncbi:MAG: hypothetical protein M5U23_02545 [Acidimicrobiia bacterium]|nr:hypothetical protein [Acidimicrobiia bacterium]
MADIPWWEGTDSTFSHGFMDFVLALSGLRRSVGRLHDQDDPYTALECCWWIAAATEACGLSHEDSQLAGVYWVRSKGIHETATAMGQMLDAGRNELEPGVMLTIPESRWIRLDGSEDGRRATYNRYLAGKTVASTVNDAYERLLRIFDEVRTASGVTDLDV